MKASHFVSLLPSWDEFSLKPAAIVSRWTETATALSGSPETLGSSLSLTSQLTKLKQEGHMEAISVELTLSSVPCLLKTVLQFRISKPPQHFKGQWLLEVER